MNRILIMGPPGAGKGTQAVLIAEHHHIPAISTGDIFRSNVKDGTPLGETARGYMAAGEYVPDSVTSAMLRERVGRPDCARGFVLDGFPRTLGQVRTLDEIVSGSRRALRAVVVLDVDTDDLVGRLLLRAATERRADDTEDVIRRRQKLYSDETAPLLEEYDRRGLLVRVDDNGEVTEVTHRLFEALGIGS